MRAVYRTSPGCERLSAQLVEVCWGSVCSASKLRRGEERKGKERMVAAGPVVPNVNYVTQSDK